MSPNTPGFIFCVLGLLMGLGSLALFIIGVLQIVMETSPSSLDGWAIFLGALLAVTGVLGLTGGFILWHYGQLITYGLVAS